MSYPTAMLLPMFASRGDAVTQRASGTAAYPRRMTVSAHDVAAVLRARLPGLGAKKLHKLLYYCQGHHLAAFDEPLFGETISAWDMGPVVGVLWHHEKSADVPTRHAVLTEAQLNTVGYVLSRYGGLSGLDLETLTHNETPWQRADQSRGPRESARIEQEWIREYFVRYGVGGAACRRCSTGQRGRTPSATDPPCPVTRHPGRCCTSRTLQCDKIASLNLPL
jgi:uncharacterized phage-associated protein